MTPSTAQAIAKRARKLLRRGDLTHRQYALLDCLLWSCRTPGRAEARVSYSGLQRLAHQARDTIARGLRRLESLGLLRRVKVRLRVAWSGGTASRQGISIYTLISAVSTESSGRTVIEGWKEIQIGEGADTHAARTALAAIAARRMGVLALGMRSRAGVYG